MPRVLWICPLVQHGLEGLWMPLVVEILDTIAPHVTRWSTTPGNRAVPFATGASNVDATQLAALEADTRIHLFEESTKDLPFDQLPGVARARMNQFCTNVGLTRPAANETLRDLCQRLTQIIDGKNIEDHLGRV